MSNKHNFIQPLPRTGAGFTYAQNKARRTGIAQCDRCGVTGTASIRRNRLVSTDLPTVFDWGQLTHDGCGGRFHAYDIGWTL